MSQLELRLESVSHVSDGVERLAQGALPGLLPLPRWQTTQPGEYFRAFERGGIFQPSAFPEIGNPNKFDEAGRPDIRLSNRGPGTGLRISPALSALSLSIRNWAEATTSSPGARP